MALCAQHCAVNLKTCVIESMVLVVKVLTI